MVLTTKKPRQTKEQVKSLWHRKAKAERQSDVICFRCGTITNKIHHHCVSHKYGKGYSVSVCTRCHGEINALVWNPEKHLLRGPYWGKKPGGLLLPEYLEKPDFFRLVLKPDERPNGRWNTKRENSQTVTVVSIQHKNSGGRFYLRGGSYGEMSRVTCVPRNMIIDTYVGTYPLIYVNGKECAAGLGLLAEYWIRDIEKENKEAYYYRSLPDDDADETDSE